MSDFEPSLDVWITYLKQDWEEREAIAHQAWDLLQKRGAGVVLEFMQSRGMPISAGVFYPDAPKPARKRKHPTRRQIERAIGLAGKEYALGPDGRWGINMDSLPHPIYRSFRTDALRLAAQARIGDLRTSAADLIEVRKDRGLYEFRYALPDVPKLPSSRRLTRAAATLAEAAECLQFRFNQRTAEPD